MSGGNELRSKQEPWYALLKVDIEVGVTDISWEEELNCAIVHNFSNTGSKNYLKKADLLASKRQMMRSGCILSNSYNFNNWKLYLILSTTETEVGSFGKYYFSVQQMSSHCPQHPCYYASMTAFTTVNLKLVSKSNWHFFSWFLRYSRSVLKCICSMVINVVNSIFTWYTVS